MWSAWILFTSLSFHINQTINSWEVSKASQCFNSDFMETISLRKSFSINTFGHAGNDIIIFCTNMVTFSELWIHIYTEQWDFLNSELKYILNSEEHIIWIISPLCGLHGTCKYKWIHANLIYKSLENWLQYPAAINLWQLSIFFKMYYHFLIMSFITVIFLYETGSIQWIYSQHYGYWWPGTQ